MSRLELWLKGEFFQEADIDLPPFMELVEDAARNFELNVEIREDYVKREMKRMKINFTRQIIKCEHDYEFYLIVGS